jgi:hypothetical protein
MNKRDFLKAAALSVATVVVQSGEAVGLNLSAAIPKNYVKLGKLTWLLAQIGSARNNLFG